MSPDEIRSRRRARLERAKRRRRRNITIFVAVTVIVVAALMVAGPWGPLRGVFYGDSASGSNDGASSSEKRAAEDGGNTDKVRAVKATEPAEPAAPARVEKKSKTAAPTVAIVVDDVGNPSDNLPLWLQVDAAISFAVMPHCSQSQSLAEEFYNAGYEVMLHIPSQNEQPNSFSGNGQLEVGMSRQTVFATLDADVATVPHVTGINNHQGGAACDSLELMTYMCEWAQQRGLYVVDSNSSRNSQVSVAAVALGMNKRKNQVFIDHQNDPDYIRGAMRKLADLARRDGTALGICHYHRPNTAAVVGEMVKVLKAEGINFAFARDI